MNRFCKIQAQRCQISCSWDSVLHFDCLFSVEFIWAIVEQIRQHRGICLVIYNLWIRYAKKTLKTWLCIQERQPVCEFLNTEGVRLPVIILLTTWLGIYYGEVNRDREGRRWWRLIKAEKCRSFMYTWRACSKNVYLVYVELPRKPEHTASSFFPLRHLEKKKSRKFRKCNKGKMWRERKPIRFNKQMFIISFCLNMFRASLCPSSGEQRPC